MHLPVPTLLIDNPFTLLAIPPDASARVVRRRIEELELEAGFDAAKSVDRAALTGARLLLDAPADRIAYELFAPWAGAPSLAPAARDHDAALSVLRTALDRRRPNQATDAIVALERWLDLSAEARTRAALDQRRSELGLSDPSSPWLAEIVGAELAPLLIARALDADASLANRCGVLAGRLDARQRAAAVAPILKKLADASDATHVAERPAGHVSRTVSAVALAATPLRSIVPREWDDLLSKLYYAANGRAVELFNDDEPHAAELILESLARIELPSEHAQQVRENLAFVKYQIAWKDANDRAGQGDWPAARAALNRALELAPDAESQRQVREALANMPAGAATRAPAARHTGAPAPAVRHAVSGARHPMLPTHCPRCGKPDDGTIDIVAFQYAVGLVIVSLKRFSSPVIACGGCRKQSGLGWAVLSTCVGWAGFRALLWTLEAWSVNLGGGVSLLRK
jgi:tetratricopeptide (TPR) repeat protein